VNYIFENCLGYLDDEVRIYEELKQRIGINLKMYTEKSPSAILRAVLNIYTPRQFEVEVLQNRREDRIELPDGSYKQCSALIGTNFDYGIYKIDGEEYRVTPDIQIDVEDMKNGIMSKLSRRLRVIPTTRKKNAFLLLLL